MQGVNVFDYNVYGKLPACYSGDIQESDIDMLKSLLEAQKITMLWTSCEMRCYEQLALIEKELGFDLLFKTKNETF